MANRPASLNQKELTGYAMAMQKAAVPWWQVIVEKPDGTRVSITAANGAPETGSPNPCDVLLNGKA